LADQKETIVYEEAGKVEEGAEEMGVKLGLSRHTDGGQDWVRIGFVWVRFWFVFPT